MNSSLSLSLSLSRTIRLNSQNPYNGQAVFTYEWDLASLAYSQETEGPYHTDLPTPDDIRRFLQLDRVELNRTIKSQNDTLTPNQRGCTRGIVYSEMALIPIGDRINDNSININL
ncbi:hypothetical protein Tco_1471256 [Tanacetum coccineum]